MYLLCFFSQSLASTHYELGISASTNMTCDLSFVTHRQGLSCRSKEQTSPLTEEFWVRRGKGDGESEGTDLAVNGATDSGGGRMGAGIRHEL